MADETVDIEIRQTQSGNAIETARQALERLRAEAARQFPETAARVQQLNRTAAVYAERYGHDDSRAVSARGDAKSLQGDLNRWARERYDMERQGRAEERRHNQNERRERKEENDDKRGLRQVGGSALHAFDSASGAPFGGLISGLANPAVLAATLGGLVVGKLAHDAMAAHDFRAQQQQIHDFDVNRLGQITGGTQERS